MKTRWIPFFIVCFISALFLGIWLGQSAEAENSGTQRNSGQTDPGIIAVVNADAGVLQDDARLNYSAAIIETLGDGFLLVSPAMAQNGIVSGIYGAVITFPSHVSERIVSFNAETPERVQLDFQVNPKLSEADYIETYIRILDLQMAINTTLSQTYVSSVFSQFHHAQDQVDNVFVNNQASVDALDIIKYEDFSPSLDLESIPEVPIEPKEAETGYYFSSVSSFASQVAGLYLGSYYKASADFLAMRTQLLFRVDEFEGEKELWLEEMELWSIAIQDYGTSMEAYSVSVGEYHEAFSEWLDENLFFISEHEQLKLDLIGWHDSLGDWHGDANDVYSSIEEHCDDIEDKRIEIEKRFDEVLDDLSEWQKSIGIWADALGDAVCEVLLHIHKRPVLDEHIQCDDGCTSDCGCYEDYFREVVKWENELETLEDALSIYYTDSSGLVFLPPEFDDSNWIKDDELELPRIEGAVIPDVTTLGEPPDYSGVKPPENIGKPEPFNRLPPDLYAEIGNPPPTPVSFWEENLYAQVDSFDYENYLSDAVEQQSNELLDEFDNYLSTVREDLAWQFQSNISIMYDVRSEYSMYLSGVRSDAIGYEAETKRRLGSALSNYFETVEMYSGDTEQVLGTFAGMMPESRTTVGVNRDLVGFTVAPFEFMPPAMRTGYVQEGTPSFLEKYRAYITTGLAASFLTSGGLAIWQERRIRRKHRGE